MTPRQKRFAWIASGLAALVLVAGLLLYALNSNIVFFYTPVPSPSPIRTVLNDSPC